MKNEKNLSSEKMTFSHVFKEFLDNYFLKQKTDIDGVVNNSVKSKRYVQYTFQQSLFAHMSTHSIFIQQYQTFGQHLILSYESFQKE